jgi:hypothetical protein
MKQKIPPQPVRYKYRWLVLLLALPVLCMAVLYGSFWMFELRPQYLEFDIQPPDYDEWIPVEHAFQEWETSRFSIVRREGYCGDCGDWNDIIKHFDRQFEKYSWVREGNGIENTPCNLHLPEAEFIPEDQPNGYVVYAEARTGFFSGYATVPVACLAVWETSVPDFYKIVLVVANPSPITAMDWD